MQIFLPTANKALLNSIQRVGVGVEFWFGVGGEVVVVMILVDVVVFFVAVVVVVVLVMSKVRLQQCHAEYYKK